jgi:hypothetical protein
MKSARAGATLHIQKDQTRSQPLSQREMHLAVCHDVLVLHVSVLRPWLLNATEWHECKRDPAPPACSSKRDGTGSGPLWQQESREARLWGRTEG